jgi:sec-independent protein translocase protein TatA
MPNLGIWEILLLLLVLLLVFGPKRLPQMGRSLGHGMREFKDSITGKTLPDDDEDEKVELTPTTVTSAQPATAPAQPVQAEPER